MLKKAGLLLPLLSLAGCGLFIPRDPMTIPIDVTIRPHVGVELDQPSVPFEFDSSVLVWIVIGLVVAGVWAFAHFGRKKHSAG